MPGSGETASRVGSTRGIGTPSQGYRVEGSGWPGRRIRYERLNFCRGAMRFRTRNPWHPNVPHEPVQTDLPRQALSRRRTPRLAAADGRWSPPSFASRAAATPRERGERTAGRPVSLPPLCFEVAARRRGRITYPGACRSSPRRDPGSPALAWRPARAACETSRHTPGRSPPAHP